MALALLVGLYGVLGGPFANVAAVGAIVASFVLVHYRLRRQEDRAAQRITLSLQRAEDRHRSAQARLAEVAVNRAHDQRGNDELARVVDDLRRELAATRETHSSAAEQRAALSEVTARLDERITRLGRRVTRERDQRIIGVARALSSEQLPDRLILLVTTHRSGSTHLFDLLRSLPGVYVEPSADIWAHLGLDGRRYPADLSDGSDATLEIEVSRHHGAMIPKFTDRHRPWRGHTAVEKLHPEFFGHDPEAFAVRLAAVGEGTRVEPVYLSRRPIDAMWSMAEYQRRSGTWYAHLAVEDIPAHLARSMRAVVALARTVPGTILDYGDLHPPGFRLRRLVSTVVGAEPALGVDDALDRTARNQRVEPKPGTFLGGEADRPIRHVDGPDGVWADRGSDIRAAEQAYAELAELAGRAMRPGR